MTRNLVTLDVREMLRAKEEPFQKIMETVENLGQDDVFELHATFKPDPLLRVLGKQGLHNTVLQMESEHFIAQFYREETSVPYFHIDNRGLQPPQPMVRTLELLDQREEFQNGGLGLEIWNERVPAFLLPELEDRGFDFEIDDEGNGTVRIKIRRKG